MKRLTEWDEYGNADIIALSDMMPEIYAELSFGETNALTDVFNRLAAYEDTGLEPDDVTNLMAAHGTAIGALAEYRALGTVKKLRALVDAPSNTPLTLEELREIVEQLEFCGYKCEGGPLNMNRAFIRLKELAYRCKPEEG